MCVSMKTKTTLVVDEETWKNFRIWCLQHDTSASAEFEAMMKARMVEGKQSKPPKGGKKS